jgi:hypothetical protein
MMVSYTIYAINNYVCVLFTCCIFTDPTNSLILNDLDIVHKDLFKDILHTCTFSECNGFIDVPFQEQTDQQVQRPVPYFPFTFQPAQSPVHQFIPRVPLPCQPPNFQIPVSQFQLHIPQPVPQSVPQSVPQPVPQPVQFNAPVDENTINSPLPDVNPDVQTQGSPIIVRSRSRRRLNEHAPIDSKVNQVVNILMNESPDTAKDILESAKCRYSVRKLGMDTDDSVEMNE